MNRIYPAKLKDATALSKLLDTVLSALEKSPLHVNTHHLGAELHLQTEIIDLLRIYHQRPGSYPQIKANDFRILFANILFRFPTVKIWKDPKGRVFLEI